MLLPFFLFIELFLSCLLRAVFEHERKTKDKEGRRRKKKQKIEEDKKWRWSVEGTWKEPRFVIVLSSAVFLSKRVRQDEKNAKEKLLFRYTEFFLLFGRGRETHDAQKGN